LSLTPLPRKANTVETLHLWSYSYIGFWCLCLLITSIVTLYYCPNHEPHIIGCQGDVDTQLM
jgi:hypothetical protein